MDDNESSHRVTISAMYNRMEDNHKETKQEISAIKSTLAVILDRDKRDFQKDEEQDRKIEKIDGRVSWLQRVLYAIAAPMTVISGTALGWQWIKDTLL